MSICYKPQAVGPFLQAAQTRRVDIAVISDSNTCKDDVTGEGYASSLRRAFAARFGQYATQLLTGYGGDGEANGQSTYANLLSPIVTNAGSTLPSGIQPWAPSLNSYIAPQIGNFVGTWIYLAAGDTVAGTSNSMQLGVLNNGWVPGSSNAKNSNGQLSAFSPTDWTQEFIVHWTVAQFPSGGGYFNPTVVQAAAQGNVYATAKKTYSVGSYGSFVDDSLTVPAGARASSANYSGMTIMPNNFSTGAGLGGPLLITNVRTEAPGVTTGTSTHILMYEGGHDARDAALTWRAYTTQAANEILRQFVRLQNASPMLCVFVMHGINDPNDTNLSVGPNPQVSSTPGGFADNLTALIEAMQATWNAAGYPPNNLFFVLGPTHVMLSRVSTMETWNGVQYPIQTAYELASMSVADIFQNTCVVRGTLLNGTLEQTAQLYQNQSWYDYQGDPHLQLNGYVQWGQRAIDGLVAEALEIRNAVII